jgi:hypothetical protein
MLHVYIHFGQVYATVLRLMKMGGIDPIFRRSPSFPVALSGVQWYQYQIQRHRKDSTHNHISVPTRKSRNVIFRG